MPFTYIPNAFLIILQLYFEDTKYGRRLSRNLFNASGNQFSRPFGDCKSNTEFLDLLKEHGIDRKPKNGRCIQIQQKRFDAEWFNPTALRKAKIVYKYGLSKCNRVNTYIHGAS